MAGAGAGAGFDASFDSPFFVASISYAALCSSRMFRSRRAVGERGLRPSMLLLVRWMVEPVAVSISMIGAGSIGGGGSVIAAWRMAAVCSSECCGICCLLVSSIGWVSFGRMAGQYSGLLFVGFVDGRMHGVMNIPDVIGRCSGSDSDSSDETWLFIGLLETSSSDEDDDDD